MQGDGRVSFDEFKHAAETLLAKKHEAAATELKPQRHSKDLFKHEADTLLAKKPEAVATELKPQRRCKDILAAVLAGRWFLAKFMMAGFSGEELFYHYRTCDECLHKVFPEHMLLLLNVPDEDEKEVRAEREAEAAEKARRHRREAEAAEDAKKAQAAIEQRMGKLEDLLSQLLDQAKEKTA